MDFFFPDDFEVDVLAADFPAAAGFTAAFFADFEDDFFTALEAGFFDADFEADFPVADFSAPLLPASSLPLLPALPALPASACLRPSWPWDSSLSSPPVRGAAP
ncbi:MAG: hypothetical protein M5U25_14095 [Planctomycetota bacterium]|nr:hypothetical protein [Planctomycetota bacterium]